jgi:hypothetical protein
MANPKFAGNWNPDDFNKLIGSGQTSFYGQQQSPYKAVYERYKDAFPQFSPVAGGDPTANLIGQIMSVSSNPAYMAAQSELDEIRAQRASELSAKNIATAVKEQSAYEKKRDERRLKLGLLANIPNVIGEAFATPGKYALLGSQMGTESLAKILNTPSVSFPAVASFQTTKYLS